MQPQAIGGVTAEISKRSLGQDDIDGYCALGKHLLKRRGIVKATHIRGPVRFELDIETREEVERMQAEGRGGGLEDREG